jgi:hypothetical protein
VAWVRERTYRPNDRRLPAKLMSAFADTVCHVISVTDLYGHILGFLDRSRYCFFQVAPQLYSWGWVDPIADPLLLRKSDRAGSRTLTTRPQRRCTDYKQMCRICFLFWRFRAQILSHVPAFLAATLVMLHSFSKQIRGRNLTLGHILSNPSNSLITLPVNAV